MTHKRPPNFSWQVENISLLTVAALESCFYSLPDGKYIALPLIPQPNIGNQTANFLFWTNFWGGVGRNRFRLGSVVCRTCKRLNSTPDLLLTLPLQPQVSSLTLIPNYHIAALYTAADHSNLHTKKHSLLL